MKYYHTLLILCTYTACNVSTMSRNDTIDISQLKATITIQDDGKGEKLSQLKVSLTDGEKQVINKKIIILLNGMPLKLYVRQGNYYDKYSSYSIDKLLRTEAYYFEIILPDSTTYPLAFIKPQKRSDCIHFSIPKMVFSNENITLQWKNINIPTTLEVRKIVQPKSNTNKHSMGSSVVERITETLTTKNGNYLIPKSFIKDSLTRVNYVKVAFNKQETGLINPKLVRGSYISYTYTFEQSIDIQEKVTK